MSTVIAAFVALYLTAYSTLQPLRKNSPATYRAAVKLGGELRVTAGNGKQYLLRLTAVDDVKIISVSKKLSICYE